MSMNLHIEATRKAFAFNAKKKKISFTDRRTFNCWQTPTNVTKEVLAKKSDDEKVKAYLDWAESICPGYEDNIYDYGAVMGEDLEYPVIGRKMVYPAKEHGKKLQDFLKNCHEEGFAVNFYMM